MNKRELILNTAIDLFTKHGFEKTPVSAICESAGVSKGLVFHHFKNKDVLLREIFLRTTEIIGNIGKPHEEISDPNKRLTALIEAIFISMAEHRKLYRFNLNVMLQPATREILSDLIDDRNAMLFETTEDIFKKISEDNSTVLTHTFVAEINGIALNYLYFYDDFPLEDIKKQLIHKYK
ncbi:TetR/AcrR family transcriptional regulator [Aliamphritea spongicola]|uniref:TetR/AcrR family transcriptional regulator n=1 Tax=Aliamphritea spongicola TaxID=707589 RepID=UPI00196B2C61|nr:TetR/AcrR family transcriptional regulator [Aliamphritea spongicola]MBN3561736.1 TetR/AcrR family transcriptional regulator [Aliamphritea spongicola]